MQSAIWFITAQSLAHNNDEEAVEAQAGEHVETCLGPHCISNSLMRSKPGTLESTISPHQEI